VFASYRFLAWVPPFMLGLALFVSAARGGTVPSPLDSLKKLQGSWSIQSDGKALKIRMTNLLASNDSIVTEQFGRELSVFAMDGVALTMTHYCNVGNQPHLRLKQQTVPNLYEFELYELVIPERAPPDHVEKIIYHFLSDKRIDLRIIWWHPSGSETEHYLLKRS
jgi:hypothetical protein